MTRVLSYGDVEVYTILTLTEKKMITRYEGSYLGQYPNQYDEDVEDWTRLDKIRIIEVPISTPDTM